MLERDQLAYLALSQYNIDQPELHFIRHNENLTYKVMEHNAKKTYVLRIHKPRKGFSLLTAQHKLEDLESEMTLLKALDEESNIMVQKPIVNNSGQLVTSINDQDKMIYATLLSWIDGSILDVNNEQIKKHIFQVGVLTGNLHNFSLKWKDGINLKRQRYDQLKVKITVDRIREGIELNLLDEMDYQIIKKGGDRIIELMNELDNKVDTKGIVHADLSPSNLIVHDHQIITPIDFCLCGHGYFYMDLGGILADFKHHRDDFIEGYRSVRPFLESDMKYGEAFFVLSILLAMATHLHNPNMTDWYHRRMKPICQDYLNPLIENKRFYHQI